MAEGLLDRRLPTISWAMYDFANTIYSAIVVTAFFPPLVAHLAGRDLFTGMAQTVSMVAAGLIVPLAGAWADRTGRGMRYLWWTTAACCAATAGIGLVGDDVRFAAAAGRAAPTGMLAAVLFLFGLANLAYQTSLVFYNSFLPAVASPRRQGFVSGLGVGLGYLGVVVALPLAYVASRATGTMRSAFFVAAAGFMVSALPCLLFVRGPGQASGVGRRSFPSPGAGTGDWAPGVWRLWRELGQTLRSLRRTPRVLFFFVGNFLCVDVVNTLIMWTRPFLGHSTKGLGWSAQATIAVLTGMAATAFLLGLGLGWLTDRIGSKRVLLGSAAGMLATIVLASVSSRPSVVVPAIVVLGSGGLAGTWVAGRKFLLDVAPAEKVGEYFGLYGLTTKLSVFGCTLFAVVGDWTGTYRAALLVQLAPLAAGIVFLALSRARRMG